MNTARDRIRLTLPWRSLACVFVVPFGLITSIIWGPLAYSGDIDAIFIMALVGLLLVILYLSCYRLDKLNSVYSDSQHIFAIQEGEHIIINWSQVKLCHNLGGMPNVMIISYEYKGAIADIKAVYFGKAKDLIKKNIELYDITCCGQI